MNNYTLTNYTQLIVFSYASTNDLVHKLSLLNKSTRSLIQTRIRGASKSSTMLSQRQHARVVKINIKSEDFISLPAPRLLFEIADKLIIQSVIPFRKRGLVLESLFREIPTRFNDFNVQLMTNEVSNDLVNQVVKREMKFSDLLLYNVTVEYSDKVDTFLKSTRSLCIYKSTFRQIFPRAITNDATNEIEFMQLEELDLQVQSTIFACDRLHSLSMKNCKLRPKQLEAITSNTIQNFALEQQYFINKQSKALPASESLKRSSPSLFLQLNQNFIGEIHKCQQSSDPDIQAFLDLISRQSDLQRLSLGFSSDYTLSGDVLNLIAENLPSNAVSQTKLTLATSGEVCSLDEILDSGLVKKANDVFIACDRLHQANPSPQNTVAQTDLIMDTGSQLNQHPQTFTSQSQNSSCGYPPHISEVLIQYRDHHIALEKIGLYNKATVTYADKQHQSGELRIVCRQ